jgi:branched-chain amino acid transport system substrate-binding protein
MKQIVQERRPKTAASIVINVPFGLLHAEALKKIAEADGIKLPLHSTFDIAGSIDTLKIFALKVSQTNPDLVLCVADYVGLEAFTKEARRLGFTGAILTTQHLDEAAKLSKQPSLWASVIGIYPQPASDTFTQAYTNEYGEAPKVYAAEGYDALLFLARALHRSINLSTTPFETKGVTGLLTSKPGVADISRLAAISMIIEGGRLIPYPGGT